MDEEINKYFRSLDATLITNRYELNGFKKTVKEKVKEIHAAHPRCKDIPLDIFSLSGEDQICNCGSTHGIIYTIHQEFKTQL